MIAITAAQMKKVDDLAAGKYNIVLEEMMELAGHHLAEMTYRILDSSLKKKKILVLAGKGNNGGGGLVSARHLYNRGANVQVILSSGSGQKPAVNERLNTLERLGINVSSYKNGMAIGKADLIIDALIGYGLKSNPKPPVDGLIGMANASGVKILALDIPSGIDSEEGKIYKDSIFADYTMTLALPKKGLLKKNARENVGALYLTDIGIPREIYKELGIDIDNIFADKDIIRIN